MFDEGLDQAAGLRRRTAGDGLRALAVCSALAPTQTWALLGELLACQQHSGHDVALVDLYGTGMHLMPGIAAVACADGRDQSLERSLDQLCARQCVQRLVVAGPPDRLALRLGRTPHALLLLLPDAAAITDQYAAIKGAVADLPLQQVALLTPGSWARLCRPLPHAAAARNAAWQGLHADDAQARARLLGCVRRFMDVQVSWLDDTAMRMDTGFAGQGGARTDDFCGPAAGRARASALLDTLSFDPAQLWDGLPPVRFSGVPDGGLQPAGLQG